MKFLVFLSAAILLSGCASNMVEIPVSALTSDESRMKAYSVIGDASTAKEAIVHKSWQTYFKQYADAYKNSGMTMTYQIMDLPGGTKIALPVVNYRPQPVLTPPPAEPSQHPVWKTINHVVDRGIMWAGIGWIAHEFRGMNEAAYDAAGNTNTYNGPTNLSGSYNTAGRDSTVTLTGDQATNTGNEVTQQQEDSCKDGGCDGDDGDKKMCSGPRGSVPIIDTINGIDFVSPTCSCGSYQAGHCNV